MSEYLPYRNTVDEIIRFSRLTLDIVKADEIIDALAFAYDLVEYTSPLDATDERSLRSEPIRKRAEAYLATAELYDKIAPFIALSEPGQKALATLSLSEGVLQPTPIEYQQAMERAADRFRQLGNDLLSKIRPLSTSIEA